MIFLKILNDMLSFHQTLNSKLKEYLFLFLNLETMNHQFDPEMKVGD